MLFHRTVLFRARRQIPHNACWILDRILLYNFFTLKWLYVKGFSGPAVTRVLFQKKILWLVLHDSRGVQSWSLNKLSDHVKSPYPFAYWCIITRPSVIHLTFAFTDLNSGEKSLWIPVQLHGLRLLSAHSGVTALSLILKANCCHTTQSVCFSVPSFSFYTAICTLFNKKKGWLLINPSGVVDVVLCGKVMRSTGQ